MGDDAFNISTHSSSVAKIISPIKFESRQRYCLAPIPWHENMHLVAADDQSKRILGEARIAGVTTRPNPAFAHLTDPAPISLIELDRPIEGLAEGMRVWEKESSNPDTTLRGCLIRQSCRLQCSVQIEHCDITGLFWFYGEMIEGPYPSSVRVSDSVLRIGRGNPQWGVIVSGAAEPDASKAPPRAIHDIVFENNRIFGSMNIQGVERLVLRGNRYPETSKMILKNNIDAIIEDDIQY